jgi:hypothetical protein
VQTFFFRLEENGFYYYKDKNSGDSNLTWTPWFKKIHFNKYGIMLSNEDLLTFDSVMSFHCINSLLSDFSNRVIDSIQINQLNIYFNIFRAFIEENAAQFKKEELRFIFCFERLTDLHCIDSIENIMVELGISNYEIVFPELLKLIEDNQELNQKLVYNVECEKLDKVMIEKSENEFLDFQISIHAISKNSSNDIQQGELTDENEIQRYEIKKNFEYNFDVEKYLSIEYLSSLNWSNFKVSYFWDNIPLKINSKLHIEKVSIKYYNLRLNGPDQIELYNGNYTKPISKTISLYYKSSSGNSFLQIFTKKSNETEYLQFICSLPFSIDTNNYELEYKISTDGLLSLKLFNPSLNSVESFSTKLWDTVPNYILFNDQIFNVFNHN